MPRRRSNSYKSTKLPNGARNDPYGLFVGIYKPAAGFGVIIDTVKQRVKVAWQDTSGDHILLLFELSFQHHT